MKAFDESYTNTWTDQTLPRLMALRSPTQSNFIRHNIPNTLPGLGGFLNDMLSFNQFGTLTGFSEMMNSEFTTPTDSNINALQTWVKGLFKTTWDNQKKDVLADETVWKGIDDPNIKDQFKSMRIKNFVNANSEDILGTSAMGENYAAFTNLTKAKDQAIFNGVFSRLLTNVSRNLVSNMKTNMKKNEIKKVLSGIDSFFGRSLGWMGRRSDNDDALPVTLQKTWYKVPKSDLGVQFISDGYVNV